MNLMASVSAVLGKRDNRAYLLVDDDVSVKLKLTKERSQMRRVKFLAANAFYFIKSMHLSLYKELKRERRRIKTFFKQLSHQSGQTRQLKRVDK